MLKLPLDDKPPAAAPPDDVLPGDSAPSPDEKRHIGGAPPPGEEPLYTEPADPAYGEPLYAEVADPARGDPLDAGRPNGEIAAAAGGSGPSESGASQGDAATGGGAPGGTVPPVASTAQPVLTAPQAAASTESKDTRGKAAFRATGLDGVRALAVLAVLAFHENLPWLRGGFLGVDMFFVLSGYLITDILAAKFGKNGRVGLRTFWQRRARRLLPALAVMLVTVTAAVAVLEPDQRASLRPALLGAVTYTSNWWQAFTKQSYFNLYGPPPPLQHLWSLAVEEQFYLLWPLALTAILIALHRPALRAAAAWAGAFLSALIMLAIYVPNSDPSRVYYGTDTHASALMIGSALALTWPLAKVAAAPARVRMALDAAGLAGLVVLGWSMWHFSGANPAVYPFGLVLAALAAGALVLAATAPGRIAAALSWRPLRWLGVRSYSVYLWHWPVIAITTGIAVRTATSLPSRAIGAILPIAIAAASWRWLEEPILRNGLRHELRRRYELLLWAPKTALRGASPGGRPPGTPRSAGPEGRPPGTPRGASPEGRPADRVAPPSPRQPGTPRRLVTAAATLTVALATLAVVGTAGYGILVPQSGSTLEQQIASGARLASQSQLPGGRAAFAWWRRPSGYPLRRSEHGGPRRPQRIAGREVMAIGDSVMLASAPELAQAIPGIYINAQVSRAMIAGVALLQQLKAEHRLRRVVIVGLGTNGTVYASQINQIRTAIGPARWLILVNTFVPRSWEQEVNSTLATAAGRYSNVLLVNWHAAIEHRTNLLWSDGIHPQPIGGKLYARVVRVVVLYALHHSPLPPVQPRLSPIFTNPTRHT